MWAGFFCRQDVSIFIFGRTKEFSEVSGMSLMCNFGVRSRFLDVIYGVRPPNGSPGKKDQNQTGASRNPSDIIVMLRFCVFKNFWKPF